MQSSQRDTQHSISIHAPHARSDLVSLHWTYPDIHFNPRSSCEERRVALTATLMLWANFNPRSSCEERQAYECEPQQIKQFQSTLLMRGATNSTARQLTDAEFQSTLLMRGATSTTPIWHGRRDFNPRSSCEERRDINARWIPLLDFNPRSSCEERPAQATSTLKNAVISIHAPHARSDSTSEFVTSLHVFQSTLLMRGATLVVLLSAVIASFQSTLLMRGATR